MEIGRKYKILLKNGSVYTCSIISEKNGLISFIDKNGLERGICIEDIKDYKELRD